MNADVVCLQEVTPRLAVAMKAELLEDYPYQIIDPRETVEGMGTISRYPIQLTGEKLPMGWVGVPQVMAMDFDGNPVTLVNFHTYPYSFGSDEAYQRLHDKRYTQAQIIASFARETEIPLILAGDANDISLSDTYRIITRAPLKDAWHEAGLGLGHTFPGSKVSGSSRPKLGKWYVPQWLTRIDYVFVSPHWGVSSVRMAQFDGVSDHRGVMAELFLGE
jgi:endonuclease/exonuclease/phosphatase family metal-dependent hydrolase